MPDHSLEPLTPLGHAEPKPIRIGNLEIDEIVGFSLASIAQRHGQKTGFNKASKSAFGMSIPQPGQVKYASDTALIWTGPEQWLFEAPNDTHEDIAHLLKAIFEETASITEQTGGWCRFDLEGESCVELLQRICALDSASMVKGNATRTIVEHISVFIACREQGNNFSVYGPRSSAESLHHALTTAANSIA